MATHIVPGCKSITAVHTQIRSLAAVHQQVAPVVAPHATQTRIADEGFTAHGTGQRDDAARTFRARFATR